MRIIETSEPCEYGGTHGYMLVDAKKRQDKTIVPRESIFASGIDFQKRYDDTVGERCVLVTRVSIFRGEISAVGSSFVAADEESALAKIGA